MKRTVIDCIEIDPKTGNVSVRFIKQHVDEDGEVTNLGYHRSSVMEPDVDIGAHLAEIEADLKANHKSALDRTHLPDIEAHAKIARKPELVAAHKAAKERGAAEFERARERAAGTTPQPGADADPAIAAARKVGS